MSWMKYLFRGEPTVEPEIPEMRYPAFSHPAFELFDRLEGELRDSVHAILQTHVGDRKIITQEDVSLSFQRACELMMADLGRKRKASDRLQPSLAVATCMDDIMELEVEDRIEEA